MGSLPIKIAQSNTRRMMRKMCCQEESGLLPPPAFLSICIFVCVCGVGGDYFILFYFNRRLITLQYCGGFCHTFTWISHGCTCVPHPDPPSPSQPSGSSQCTRPEHPVSCIEPGLVIYFTYDIIYMFQCYSLKSSHPRLLPQSPKVCSLYLCLFLLSHI